MTSPYKKMYAITEEEYKRLKNIEQQYQEVQQQEK